MSSVPDPVSHIDKLKIMVFRKRRDNLIMWKTDSSDVLFEIQNPEKPAPYLSCAKISKTSFELA